MTKRIPWKIVIKRMLFYPRIADTFSVDFTWWCLFSHKLWCSTVCCDLKAQQRQQMACRGTNNQHEPKYVIQIWSAVTRVLYTQRHMSMSIAFSYVTHLKCHAHCHCHFQHTTTEVLFHTQCTWNISSLLLPINDPHVRVCMHKWAIMRSTCMQEYLHQINLWHRCKLIVH